MKWNHRKWVGRILCRCGWHDWSYYHMWSGEFDAEHWYMRRCIYCGVENRNNCKESHP